MMLCIIEGLRQINLNVLKKKRKKERNRMIMFHSFLVPFTPVLIEIIPVHRRVLRGGKEDTHPPNNHKFKDITDD